MKVTFRAIRTKSRSEFDWLIEHLSHEAFRARDHWDFWGALYDSFDEYSADLDAAVNPDSADAQSQTTLVRK